MRSIWQDVRYASRVLRAHPGTVAIAVLSLALGVGANSIVFSLVDGMFLRPLQVNDPASLVRIEWQSVDGRSSSMAWADLQSLKETGGAFEDIAAQNRRGGLLDIGGDVELTLLTIVSDNYFPLLGLEAAQAQLDTFARRLQQEQPESSRGRRLVVKTQAEYEASSRGRLLSALLLSITGLLVVIACANVAQLLLAMSETRRREIAIRQALGASRHRLFRQLLTESTLLAIAGALVALVVAGWLIPLLPSLLPTGPSFIRYDTRLDLRVVVATFVTCTATVLLFGLAPAVEGSRADINSVIKAGGWVARRRFRGRNMLVISQAMLGVTLLSTAGLLALSFARARDVPPDQQVLRIRYNQISPDYFAVAGTRLLEGRAFSSADADGTLRVAIVNATMARQFWPADNAIGSWIRVDDKEVQIVGIAENAAVNTFHEPPQLFLYFPFAQVPAGEVTFVYETVGEPTALLPAIKREMRAVAPGHAQLFVNTLRQHVQEALYQDWLQAVLSITIAVIGMALASVGLAGVVIHSVTRRSREIGVRIALGAQRRDVVAMVLEQGLVLSGVGGLFGVGLSLLAGKAISSLLFGVSPSDPIVIGSSVAVVIVIGLLGSVYPAWKATRVDPVRVLRAD